MGRLDTVDSGGAGVDEVGRGVPDCPVPEPGSVECMSFNRERKGQNEKSQDTPIRHYTEGHSLGLDLEGEDLSDDDPRDGLESVKGKRSA